MSTRFQFVVQENLPRRRRPIRKMGIPQSGALSDGDRPGRCGDFAAGSLTGPGEHFPLANAGGVSCSDPLRSSESSHAKDQEVRCETLQTVRQGQAAPPYAWFPAPALREDDQAETSCFKGQAGVPGPCGRAQTLSPVRSLSAPQPSLRQAGDFQGDPPATTTLLITCLVPPTPPRRASAARRC